MNTPSAREHHAPAAERVAEAAIDRGGDGVGDQVGDHDPGDALDVAQRAADRRQRGGDDRLVHRRHEHRQHDRGEDGQEQRSSAGARRGEGRGRKRDTGGGFRREGGAGYGGHRRNLWWAAARRKQRRMRRGHGRPEYTSATGAGEADTPERLCQSGRSNCPAHISGASSSAVWIVSPASWRISRFGQSVGTRQTADVTDQNAAGTHQHARFAAALDGWAMCGEVPARAQMRPADGCFVRPG